MKTYLSSIAVVMVSTSSSLFAHPGHPGHEEWPFPDFNWALIGLAITLLGLGVLKLFKKA